jgi:hypothetical protein
VRRASGWHWVALGVLLVAAGCLVPQDDTILEDIPPPVNLPPSIVESEVQPASRIFTVDGGTGCPALVFSAPVQDPDLQDILYYDYYVDSLADTGQVAQGTVQPSGSLVRTETATYTVDFADAGKVQTPGTHYVEVLVADGPLVNGVPIPRTVVLPDGGTRIDATFTASYVWLVTVTGGPCP